MINCFYDCYTILNKVYSDGSFLKQALADTVIEEKNRALTVKICYGVLDKDAELSYYITKLCDKNPKLAIRTILKISFYSIKYLNKHVYAVTQNAVELTKKLGKGGASGFVNAVLRKFSTTDIPLPKGEIAFLSVKYSYPDFIVKELIKDYGKDRAEKIMASQNLETTLAFYGCDGGEYLKERKVEFEQTSFENVYSCKNFVRNEDYDKGIYTFQSLGSVAVCDAIEGGNELLDCCSAPGGKSIRLSYKFKKVTSFDIYPHRVKLISEYKRRMHVDNVYESVEDSSKFNPVYENAFDVVLCDAPCSGAGVFNDNPDMKLFRSENALTELNDLQKSILNNVSCYVKKGGFLYYSTCSILHRENMTIINSFLSDKTDFELVEISSPLQAEKGFGYLQFLPDVSGGLGFFVCKMKRKN